VWWRLWLGGKGWCKPRSGGKGRGRRGEGAGASVRAQKGGVGRGAAVWRLWRVRAERSLGPSAAPPCLDVHQKRQQRGAGVLRKQFLDQGDGQVHACELRGRACPGGGGGGGWARRRGGKGEEGGGSGVGWWVMSLGQAWNVCSARPDRRRSPGSAGTGGAAGSCRPAGQPKARANQSPVAAQGLPSSAVGAGGRRPAAPGTPSHPPSQIRDWQRCRQLATSCPRCCLISAHCAL